MLTLAKRALIAVAGPIVGLALLMGLAHAQGNTTGNVISTCGTVSPSYNVGNPGPFTLNPAGQLCVNTSVSASITGFHPETVQTPVSITTGGNSSASFTAGKAVLVANAGTTNTMYCQPGASAGTSGIPIAPNSGWVEIQTTSETQVSCATSTSTTTANFIVGTGIATGTGGGSGGSGGSVTQGTTPWIVSGQYVTSTLATWTNGTTSGTNVDIPGSDQVPNSQVTLTQGTLTGGAVTFRGKDASGTYQTLPVAQVIDCRTLVPLSNPYTLVTGTTQTFCLLGQGYGVLNVDVTTNITSSGNVVVTARPVPYSIVLSALLNGSPVLSHQSGASASLTSFVAKNTAGNLYAFNCTGIGGGAAGFCVAYNGSSAPGTGALTAANVLDFCWFPATAQGCSLSRIPAAVAYSTGITILITSAATPYTYTTGTAIGAISADYF